ncbi:MULTISPECIES: DNA-packaging protein FI [Enterobacter cloacae complex]|uniref:DNA-packaging protein FI n=1 Tax=Enterobacter cloacae complex TaxID=354276 RepID=UPI0014328F06|nr:DNA-packaging protein FI [Enterobacter cloacae]HAV2238011.1 DNA-packaging protein [Enterobacter cloacae]HDC4264197.1 DNA-packaging protein [Enterobacter cloacae]
MTEKEKLIARLNDLGTQLNREVSTSGTIQELTMRIAELEEELDGDASSVDGENVKENAHDSTDIDTDTNIDTDSTDIDSTENDVAEAEKVKTEAVTTDDRVSVETLATLHVDALHATRNEPVSIVEPGVIIRVSEQDADELIAKGLAREV